MKTISVKIQDKNLDTEAVEKEETITANFPENWSEITPYHLRRIVYYQGKAGQETSLFYALSDLSNQDFDNLMEELIFQEALDDALELVSWVTDKDNPIEITKSLLPKIGIFKGPFGLLNGITVGQFQTAQILARAAMKNPKYINKFCGALYRPFGLPFFRTGEWFFTLLARLFMSKVDKHMALLNFAGLMRGLSQFYTYTYLPGEEQTGMPDFGMEGLMIARAKQGSFGTYRQLRNEDFTRFMKDVEMTNAEAYMMKQKFS